MIKTSAAERLPVASFRAYNQIYREARSNLYEQQHFFFQRPSCFQAFAEMIGENIKLIRNVEIFWVGSFQQYIPHWCDCQYQEAVDTQPRVLIDRNSRAALKFFRQAVESEYPYDEDQYFYILEEDCVGNILSLLPGPRSLPNFKIRFLAIQDTYCLKRLQDRVCHNLAALAQHIEMQRIILGSRLTPLLAETLRYSPNLETLTIHNVNQGSYDCDLTNKRVGQLIMEMLSPRLLHQASNRRYRGHIHEIVLDV